MLSRADLASCLPSLGKPIGPDTHLCRTPVVRGIVEWSRDGRVMREGWVLALHWMSVLISIAAIVIASCIPARH